MPKQCVLAVMHPVYILCIILSSTRIHSFVYNELEQWLWRELHTIQTASVWLSPERPGNYSLAVNHLLIGGWLIPYPAGSATRVRSELEWQYSAAVGSPYHSASVRTCSPAAVLRVLFLPVLNECGRAGSRSWTILYAAMEHGKLFKDLYELREDLGKCVAKSW